MERGNADAGPASTDAVEWRSFCDVYSGPTTLYQLLRRRQRSRKCSPIFLQRTVAYTRRGAGQKFRRVPQLGSLASTKARSDRLHACIDELIERVNEREEQETASGTNDTTEKEGNAIVTRRGLAPSRATAAAEEYERISHIRYQVIEPEVTEFQYTYGEGGLLSQRQIMVDQYRCPWCNIDCCHRTGLMLHLSMCHDRFQFKYIEVSSKLFRVVVAPSTAWRAQHRQHQHHIRDIRKRINAKMPDLPTEPETVPAPAAEFGQNIAQASSLSAPWVPPAPITHADIGARVRVKGYCDGTLLFLGLRRDTGKWRAGVALDQPIGKNSGIVAGTKYFDCASRSGVLVRLEKVERVVAPIAPVPTATRIAQLSREARAISYERKRAEHESKKRQAEAELHGVRDFVHCNRSSSKRGMARMFRDHRSLFSLAPEDGKRNIVSDDTNLGPRQIYHSETFMPKESEAALDADSDDDFDTSWFELQSRKLLDELQDLNGGEKEMMHVWNKYVHERGMYRHGESQFVDYCEQFIDTYGKTLLHRRLRQNFTLHMASLIDFGLLEWVDHKLRPPPCARELIRAIPLLDRRPKEAVELIARLDTL